MRKLYTIIYAVSYGPQRYDDPLPYVFYDRILARHAEDARERSWDRTHAALVREGLYDPDHDWLTIAATLRGRHSCDED